MEILKEFELDDLTQIIYSNFDLVFGIIKDEKKEIKKIITNQDNVFYVREGGFQSQNEWKNIKIEDIYENIKKYKKEIKDYNNCNGEVLIGKEIFKFPKYFIGYKKRKKIKVSRF